MPNVVERTARSADRKIPSARENQQTRVIDSDVIKPLVPVFKELLNTSKISSTSLTQGVTHAPEDPIKLSINVQRSQKNNPTP
jgi:hypothetical protein